MDDLPDISMGFPPLPSSGSPSRAASVVGSEPEPSQTLFLLRQFLQEPRDRLHFSPAQIPIPTDRQLCDLSNSETILIPFLCSGLNVLKSMTHQLDVLTTQMGNIQSMVAILPTFPVMESALAPINASIRDLSHSTTSAPPPVPIPARPVVPPSVSTTRAASPSPPPRPRALPPKPSGSSFDPDIPRYDPVAHIFYQDPRAYATKFPDCGEANVFRDGKYTGPASFVSGHLDPDCTKPQPAYAQVASSSAPKKSKKNKNSTSASKVAAVVNSAPVLQKSKSLPSAERRFYAPRSPPTEHPESTLIAATFSDIAARVLRDANCTLPLAITAKVNDRGSVTLLVSNPTNPAAAFAPYFDALTTQLNRSFPVGDSPSLPFHLAPNAVQLAIHSLPLGFLPWDPDELFSSLLDSILNSKDMQILSARFLNPNPESIAGKSATSVMVAVNPGDVPVMGTSISPFSRSRSIERAYSSNRYTQCRNCWGFGHVAPCCPLLDTVCPLCSLNHSRSNHQCPNPTWPSGGSLKATPGCCCSSPSHCTNRGGEHPALFKDCPSHLPSPALWRSAPPPENTPAPPLNHEMDTATDDDNPPAPSSPPRSPQRAFEAETPRAWRTTMIPASPKPTHTAGAPSPEEATSLSPDPHPNPGLAR